MKIKKYKTTILPVVLYGYKTWFLILMEERKQATRIWEPCRLLKAITCLAVIFQFYYLYKHVNQYIRNKVQKLSIDIYSHRFIMKGFFSLYVAAERELITQNCEWKKKKKKEEENFSLREIFEGGGIKSFFPHLHLACWFHTKISVVLKDQKEFPNLNT